MNDERFWLLVSLQLAGEATAEELEELSAYLKEHPGKGLQVDIMRNMWKKGAPIPVDKARNFDKHLQRLSSHLSQPVMQYETEPDGVEEPQPRRRSILRWLLPAASVAAAVLIYFLVIAPGNENKSGLAQKQSPGNTVATQPGSKSQITLPDGTQVWINADSKITYDQQFPGKYREVYLSGEAYFDVVHDTSRPFIIHTRSIDVKVLGTSFNVRSYPNEKTTETALIRGSVEVTLHKSPDQKIILKPNQKLVVNNDDTAVSDPATTDLTEPTLTLSKVRFNKSDSSSSVETMWVNNKLAFENETFERMAIEMERWYNVSFHIKNEQMKKLHFSAVFENKSLAEVLEALSYSRQFHYEIKDGKVTVW